MAAPRPEDRTLRRIAAMDFLAWLVGFAADVFPDTATALVAFGGAVMVPIGVHAARNLQLAPGPCEPAAPRWVVRGVSLGAPFALLSTTVPRGPTAAALAAPWLVATLLVALSAALRLYRRRARGPITELAVDGAFAYLPVGAIWLVASRWGVPLLGFHEPVVTYTANHFHYAGFAAPLVAGLVGRRLAETTRPRSRRVHAVAAAVILSAIPLVAAGIQFSHTLELPAALLLGTAMWVLAGLLLFEGVYALRAPTSRTPEARFGALLFFIAAASLVVSMSLVVLFATSGSATRGAAAPAIPFTTMVRFHGVLNALGFASAALLAVQITPRPLTDK
ncbi:MAG: YndJ family transporter [Polyangiaceae bacterium]